MYRIHGVAMPGFGVALLLGAVLLVAHGHAGLTENEGFLVALGTWVVIDLASAIVVLREGRSRAGDGPDTEGSPP